MMAEYGLVEDGTSFLGSGTFGVAEKVVRKSDRQASHPHAENLHSKTSRNTTDYDEVQVFACKTIRFASGEKHKEPARREYSVLSVLDHPNIVKYIDIRWTPTSARIYMEFCEGGSLDDFISQKTDRLVMVLSSNRPVDGG